MSSKAWSNLGNPTICRTCGETIRWSYGHAYNGNGVIHTCKAKIKKYSKEEIEEYKKKKGIK